MAENGSPARAVSSGFFGCFGVLAAIVAFVVFVVFVAAVRGAGSSDVGRSPTPPTAATLKNAGYCVEGLHQARASGRVTAAARLRMPWQITDITGEATMPLLACGIDDGQRRVVLTVRTLCGDEENAFCASLEAVEPPL